MQFVGVRLKRPEAASVHLAAQTKKGGHLSFV